MKRPERSLPISQISGPINGTDIKFLREKINNGPLTTLDLSEARIVKGGEAYDGSNQTENNVIGQGMFYECAKLRAIELPTTVTAIKSTAFASTGLVEVDIPNSVLSVGGDAFPITMRSRPSSSVHTEPSWSKVCSGTAVTSRPLT